MGIKRAQWEEHASSYKLASNVSLRFVLHIWHARFAIAQERKRCECFSVKCLLVALPPQSTATGKGLIFIHVLFYAFAWPASGRIEVFCQCSVVPKNYHLMPELGPLKLVSEKANKPVNFLSRGFHMSLVCWSSICFRLPNIRQSRTITF